MSIFTSKSHISTQNAMIGESLENNDIQWVIANYEYANGLFEQGILEDRGYITVNDIHYKLFYLPPIPHNYHSE